MVLEGYHGRQLEHPYRFSALDIFPQQPVELQVAFPLVAGLQALLDLSVDGANGEDAERRVIGWLVVLLLSLGENGKEDILLGRDIEGLCQHISWLGEVCCLQEAVLRVPLDTAKGQRDVGVEFGVVFAETDDARCVKEIAGGVDGDTLWGLWLDSQKIDKVAAGKPIDVEDVKVGNKGQGI